MKRTDRYVPPFCQKILRFVKKKGLLSCGDKVILAVSGGIDSVVMVDVMVHLQKMLKVECYIAHVNHQLRGKESNDDEKFVRKLAKQYNVECFVEKVQTKKRVKEKKGALQEIAREIRYSFFDILKKSLDANRVATAHNANDNAETMLINLIRGGGIEGLHGIPIQRHEIVRPLLCVSRKEIVTYAKQQKLTFREDSSNLKDDYTRNYLRHNIIPKLEERINPSLIKTLGKESEIVALNSEFIEQLVDSSYELVVKKDEIVVHQAKSLHQFLLQMIIRRFLLTNNIEPSFDNINTIIDLMDLQKGKIFDIDKIWVAEKKEQTIKIRKRREASGFSLRINEEGTYAINNFVFSITKSSLPDNKSPHDASIEYIDASKVEFPIIIRSWKKGDAFIPLGMKGKKKLSDFLGEQKLSAEEKNSVPIVEISGALAWVGRMRIDERFKISNSTTETYTLSITPNDKKNDSRE